MAGKHSFVFQLLDSGRIGWLFIHVDDSWRGIAGAAQRLAEEAFRGRFVAFGGEQKIDGLPRGVHRSIEVSIFSLHLTIGLVGTVGAVGRFEKGTATFRSLRAIALDPAEHTGV